jgi:hypothetical protein
MESRSTKQSVAEMQKGKVQAGTLNAEPRAWPTFPANTCVPTLPKTMRTADSLVNSKKTLTDAAVSNEL